MQSITLSLGLSIAKILIKVWLGKKEDVPEIAYNDIFDLIKTNSLDLLEKRKLARDFETIGDKISENLNEILINSNLQQNQINAITNEVLSVVRKINITHQMLLKFSNDPKKLYEKLISASVELDKGFDFEESELFKKCIKSISQYIIDIAPLFPNYTRENFHDIIDRFNIVIEKIDKLLIDTRLIENSISHNQKTQVFENEYRRALIRKYNKVDLFDANVNREIRRYDLELAYIDLETSSYDDDCARIKTSDILELIQEHDKICIIGEAGTGKTTLLQWLTLQITSNNESKITPFFVELRKINTWPNINLNQFVSLVIQDTINSVPDLWLKETLEKGNALILIDGLDEIEKKERDIVFNWLQELEQEYNFKYIITTRPSGRESSFSFFELELMPMNEKKVWLFIQYWHKAVLLEPCLEDKDNIRIIEKKLITKISLNQSILKLATNPLLCAMICALHYQNNLLLPSNKNELYEECCKMLLESRDKARNIKTCKFMTLSYRNKRAILDDLAYWMMRNEKVAAEIEDVKLHIKEKTKNMNIIKDETEIGELVEYFIERSGLIREPENGVIDFIHKTFQEYMASQEISIQGDWGLLISNAKKDSWRETIILAMNNTNKKIADSIIRAFIEYGKKDKTRKIKYYTLAMACTLSAVEVSIEVRQEIEKITKKLIPPTTNAECMELANSGDYIIPYLKNKSNYSKEERVLCIRTLKFISTKNVLKALKTYFNDNMQQDVLNEIEQVLSDISISDITLFGLSEKILNYILTQIHDRVLITTEILLYSIKQIRDFDKKTLSLKHLISLTVKNYSGKSLDFLNFTNLEKLEVRGHFETIPILKNIQNLNRLNIYSENSNFDIYNLNKYNSLVTIKQLVFSTKTGGYINFKKLFFLQNIEYLSLDFNSEVDCDWASIKDLKNLNELELSLNYNDWEICFHEICSLKTLEKLTLVFNHGNIPAYAPDFFANKLKSIRIIASFESEELRKLIRDLNLTMPKCDISYNITASR